MRRWAGIVAAVAALVPLGASAAESWHAVSDRDAGFAAEFPTEPHVVTRDYTTALAARGRVRETVYSSDVGGAIFRIAIADFSGLGADPDRVVDEAVSRLAGKGRVAIDFGLEINVVHGREYVVVGDDGTRYTDALFFHKDRFYRLGVVHPPAHSDPAGSSSVNMFLSKFQFLNPF